MFTLYGSPVYIVCIIHLSYPNHRCMFSGPKVHSAWTTSTPSCLCALTVFVCALRTSILYSVRRQNVPVCVLFHSLMIGSQLKIWWMISIYTNPPPRTFHATHEYVMSRLWLMQRKYTRVFESEVVIHICNKYMWVLCRKCVTCTWTLYRELAWPYISSNRFSFCAFVWFSRESPWYGVQITL